MSNLSVLNRQTLFTRGRYIIHSFRDLSYDSSTPSSKASSPQSAIYCFFNFQ